MRSQIQWNQRGGGGGALIGAVGGEADVWGGKQIWVFRQSDSRLRCEGGELSPVGDWFLFFLGAHVFYETIFIVSETMLAQHSTRRTVLSLGL